MAKRTVLARSELNDVEAAKTITKYIVLLSVECVRKRPLRMRQPPMYYFSNVRECNPWAVNPHAADVAATRAWTKRGGGGWLLCGGGGRGGGGKWVAVGSANDGG